MSFPDPSHVVRGRTARILLASSASAALLLGCGGEERAPDPAPAPATETAAAPAPAPAPAAAAEAPEVEIEQEVGKPARFTGTSKSGKPFEASIGGNVEIPADFPTDVPTYPDATPMAAMSAAGEGTMVTFRSREEQGKIYDFYQSELAGAGWSIESEKNFGGQRSIDAVKDDRKVSVSITGTRGDTRISVIVATSE